jgi:MFS family permease
MHEDTVETAAAATPPVEPGAAAPDAPRGRPWWASGGFGRLLLGQSISAVGSQVTFIAVPLIAVTLLGATPGAMGLLGALDNLPYLLVGLWIGILVDRNLRRRLMVVSDLVRAAAVITVPIAAFGGWLSFVQLCVVVFVVGIGNIVFDVSCQAQLPELADADHTVAANGALQTSTSLASVGAPGVVGVLIRLVGAPFAILLDALSYVLSALSIASIRTPERHRPSEDGATWEQVKDGLRIVRDDVRLVGIAGGAAMLSIAMNSAFAVLMFYLASRLGLDASMIGLVFLAFGVGGAIGALTVSPVAARVGTAAVLIAGPLLAAAGLSLFALTGPPSPGSLAIVFAGAVMMGAGMLAFSVLAAGVRQLLAPERARGRVLGTLRFIEWGSMPLGSVIGGIVGEALGVVPALWVSAVLLAGASVWILATPLRTLRDLPTA